MISYPCRGSSDQALLAEKALGLVTGLAGLGPTARRAPSDRRIKRASTFYAACVSIDPNGSNCLYRRGRSCSQVRDSPRQRSDLERITACHCTLNQSGVSRVGLRGRKGVAFEIRRENSGRTNDITQWHNRLGEVNSLRFLPYLNSCRLGSHILSIRPRKPMLCVVSNLPALTRRPREYCMISLS